MMPGVLLCIAAFGQAASNPPAPGSSARPTFEVASVKPAARRPGGAGERAGGGVVGGGCPTSLKMDRSRVDVQCATIAMLIGYAFRISPDRVTGPDWMMGAGSPRFDIAAKIPQGASEHQVPEMFQALLADRFKLAFHRGNKNGATYALVVEKGGLKLKEAVPEAGAQVSAAAADPGAPPSIDGFFGAVQTRTTANADGRSSTTTISNPRMGTVRQTGDPFGIQRWEAPSISLEGLGDLLDKVTPLSSPVIDMTGLKGRFQMVLEVSLRDARPGRISVDGNPTAVEGPGTEMEEAILKGFNDGLRKLGLKLERRKGTVEAVVVDHVEKTPTEN
jgi:uncharacterized protein (TIGR03435 family)